MKNFLRYFLTLIFLSSPFYAMRGDGMLKTPEELKQKYLDKKTGNANFEEFDHTSPELIFTITQKVKNEPNLERALRLLKAIKFQKMTVFPEGRLYLSMRLEALLKNRRDKELVRSISKDINKDLDTRIAFSDGEFKEPLKSVKDVFNEKIKNFME